MRFNDVVSVIEKKYRPKRAEDVARFFKTGDGQYSHGDIFRGLRVPEMREIGNKFKDLSISDIKKLLKSKIHEYRYVALLIMDIQFSKANLENKKKIVDVYLAHTKFVNNWDLVDTSASYILGNYLYNKDRNVLYKLVVSKNLWERRISIVATYAFIRKGDLKDALKISQLLLGDTEDLIHKAVGWMLREVGKKDEKLLRSFLDKNIKKLPRTTLRYSIERFPELERQRYLHKK